MTGLLKWVGILNLALLTAVGPTRAASPREELLRLVPQDVGFCLLVEDLRGHAGPFLRSPFFAQLQASPLGAWIGPNAPEMQKLADADRFLQQQLETSLVQLRDDILGDAFAFAYRPGPAGQPELEQGVILIHAGNEKLLARILGRLDEVQKQSGEVKEVETLSHRDVRYRRRVESKGTRYELQRGSLLALTSQEAMLHRVIDLDLTAPKSDSPVARQFRELGSDARLARLWLNPRTFEPELRKKAAAALGSEALVLKTLLTYWQALDSVGLSLGVQREAELALTVRARTAELPAAARRFLSEAARPSELWTRFPEDAVLTVAGRLDVGALIGMVGEFLDEDARKALRSVLDHALGAALTEEVGRDVLPNLGPDVGVCVVAPPARDPNWFPHVVGTLRVRPGDGAIPADLALSGALNAFAMLAVLDHNRKSPDRVRLRATALDGVEVKYLQGESFPPGFQPTFAMKDGHLVLGSSPEAIRRFQAAGSTALPALPTGETPLLKLSLRELSKYLNERRDAIVAHVAAKNKVSKEEAAQQIDRALALFALVDWVTVTQRSESGQATLTLRVRTAQPLR